MLLRNQGIETLLLTGVNTNVCVESTARDGFFLNYYVAMVTDCTACPYDDLYHGTLKNIEMYFGDLVTSRQLIEIWKSQL